VRLLLVEHAKRVQELLSETLENAGYRLDIVGSIADLQTSVTAVRYDLVVIDPWLPDGDGLSAIRALRASHFAPPILIIAARASVEDRVKGLDSGADDHLTRPLNSAELLARIRALLRRPYELRPPTLRKGRIELDPSNYEVHCQGQPLDLRPAERRLLTHLMQGHGRIVLKSALEDALSHSGRDISANALEALVSRLRKALRKADSGLLIDTIRGVGYRLIAEE
jgi:two-component system OmpR family response regulator